MHVLDEVMPGVWSRRIDESGIAVTEEVFVAFDNSVLADIETYWDDLDGWEDALEAQPHRALSETVAFALGYIVIEGDTGRARPDMRRAGKAMLDGENAAYSTAIGTAFMISQGIPPEKAGEVLRAGLKGIEEGQEEAGKIDLQKLLATGSDDPRDTQTDPLVDTTGPLSTPDGSASDSTSTDSGDSPQPSPSS
ncbi:hypothetical protein [Phycicoccus sp.]|uniref:hypothetical protein n=1 Tax=Phycicoccus sp. TaxID=1902410 RepID=UPI002CC52D60|nr:hypothetical protein [Phycicoccus sp.]HMM95403.1 hypothetical protein [Phycicoccus sp.]